MPKLIDLTGSKLGRLIVLRRGANIGGKPGWVCECSCGNIKTFRGGDLRSGESASCGCLRNDKVRSSISTHGDAPRSGKRPEYNIWCSMKARCSDRDARDRQYYFDRGIRVCERWSNSYAAFIADMGPRPSSKHTIDRKDNDRGYEPDNCRWATWSEQRRNTRAYLAAHGGNDG